MVTKQKTMLDVPCSFGGVGIGKDTIRIGVRIDRNRLNIEAADEVFCGRRIACCIEIRPGGDDSTQTYMGDMVDCERLEGVADVHRFNVTPTQIGAGLTFSRRDIDEQLLTKFATLSGRFAITEAHAIPDDVKESKPKTSPIGTYKVDGAWANYPLSKLFDKSLLARLNEANLETIGDIQKFLKDPRKTLADIPNVGEAAVTKISDKLEEFWRDNPDHGQGAAPKVDPDKPTAAANGKTARKKQAAPEPQAATNGDHATDDDGNVLKMMGVPVKVEKAGRPKNPK